MDKYFDTGQITIGEDKDTELISSYENMDVYDIKKISNVVGHNVEKLTIINDGSDHLSFIIKVGYRWNKIAYPNDIVAMSKIGYNWNRTIVHHNEAKLIRNASELRIIACKGVKYKVTEFMLVINGKYLE